MLVHRQLLCWFDSCHREGDLPAPGYSLTLTTTHAMNILPPDPRKGNQIGEQYVLTMHECPRCEGTGMMDDETLAMGGRGPEPEPVWKEEKSPCATCDSKGVVFVPELAHEST